jgi:hypothetical protein
MKAGVMEEVLLSIAGLGSKVGGDEGAQFEGFGLVVREVEVAERAKDPDVHRKGIGFAIGEEEDAIGDLVADAAQFGEELTCGVSGERGEVLKGEGI